MTVAGQNIELFQGDNKIIVITVKNKSTGLPQNLTGYSVVWCVHTQSPSPVIVMSKTTDLSGGITIPDPTNGEIHIELTQMDTENMIPKIYGHQCEIDDSAGNHDTVTTGYFKVHLSHTHHLL
jgi:hypothetical protein